ncbi:hypothetical protein B0H63DRAFT_473895 [Podospora didyma]|uniref:SnoaL-like domain-containing protein n=1 Tax=Podospora didyma TaxID=330526 RepID=A0AAE0NQQ0_9PEZI|nr:hypothetical protein B0H63DRAFT_473895 [Podospora didyma]
MAAVTVHYGSYITIQKDSSPGLEFLQAFLTACDSLDIHGHGVLSDHLLHHDATFAVNNGPAVKRDQVLHMLAMRSTKVAKFGHDVHTAWDVAKDDGGRTVMYESTSFTVLKDDPEGVEVRVNEFSVIEISRSEGGQFQAVELRTYMDPAPVSSRAQQLVMGKMEQGNKAPGMGI